MTKTVKNEKKPVVMAMKKFQQVAENCATTLKTYDEKYLSNRLDSSRKFVDTRYNKMVEKLKDYNDKFLAKHVETGKDFVDTRYKQLNQQITKVSDQVIEKGRTVEKEVKNKIDHYFDNGMQYIVKLSVVENTKKRVSNGLQAVPNLINIPAKEDIQKLISAMELLSSNVETLTKKTKSTATEPKTDNA